MLLTAPLGSMRAALSRRLRPDGSSSATVRNVLWSLAGTGLPLIVAAASIPSLIAALGTTRFGVLSLAWIVVGYFSLFDLGLFAFHNAAALAAQDRGPYFYLPKL